MTSVGKRQRAVKLENGRTAAVPPQSSSVATRVKLPAHIFGITLQQRFCAGMEIHSPKKNMRRILLTWYAL
jgi:hypothetical protein